MPRLPFLEDHELTEEALGHIRHAESAGSPDPRVLRIIFRAEAGRAWYRYWRTLTQEGVLPIDLKELCRVKIAFDHTCGYCSTVRSAAAKDIGLQEQKIQEVWNFEESDVFDDRERMALRYAHYIRFDLDKLCTDEFYDALKELFTEEEIIELGLWCCENLGAGSFVRTLNIVTWGQACELNPLTAANSRRATAAE